MERYCSTGQSSQQAVAPTEKEVQATSSGEKQRAKNFGWKNTLCHMIRNKEYFT
jgi:hypothetical protein